MSEAKKIEEEREEVQKFRKARVKTGVRAGEDKAAKPTRPIMPLYGIIMPLYGITPSN